MLFLRKETLKIWFKLCCACTSVYLKGERYVLRDAQVSVGAPGEASPCGVNQVRDGGAWHTAPARASAHLMGTAALQQGRLRLAGERATPSPSGRQLLSVPPSLYRYTVLLGKRKHSKSGKPLSAREGRAAETTVT